MIAITRVARLRGRRTYVPIDPSIDPPTRDCGLDLMERGHAWLVNQLQAHLSKPVVYQRGDLKAAICATFGQKLLKLDDGYGNIRMEWTDRDFLIPASVLKLGGQAVLPERGDIVKVKEGGVTRVFEVMAPGAEPPWKWSDPYRQMLRIHAKLIEES